MLYEQTTVPERAIIVGVTMGTHGEWPVDESLAELARLVDTAGAVVVGEMTQKLERPNPRTFIGPGKAEELAEMARALDADLVVFDDELTPSQQSNLEHVCKECKVIDRTALILDIFALHATSREGRLQVRLAQNQYLYPRLRGMWAHLASNRMGGGVGSRFGEGESQLEVDRRMVRKRITSIRRELADLASTRQVQRSSREGSGIYRVCLAGYTNAGKSSLINALTGADVLSYDKLFATLDSTTRKLTLPEGRIVTLTDTVGFIQKLPHSLVDAFKSTLDEIREADLILHVCDAASHMREEQMQSVRDVLEEIGAAEIPSIDVYNKMDLLDPVERAALSDGHPDARVVSALTGEGLVDLAYAIQQQVMMSEVALNVLVPYSKGDLVSLAHSQCSVDTEEYSEEGTILSLRVPPRLVAHFDAYRM